MSSATEGLGRSAKLAAVLALCLGALLLTAQGAQAQAPTITVDKTATPLSLPEPGGAFTFNILVTNTSNAALTITGLTDNVYGSLATQGTCTTAVGTVLVATGTYSCSFSGPFTGVAGSSLTDIVTVTAVTAQAATATDTDDATVTITPVLTVDKTATPTSRPEPGGTFTFDIVVTNAGSLAQTITALTDNVYGNLASQGTCTTAVGTVLIAAGTYSCSFTGNFTGNADDSQTDIVTATATDGENTTTAADDAVVTITDVPPTIDVIKTADPSSLVEPGGTFTFDVTVVNTSAEPVTITAILDDVYGDLDGQGTCVTGATLAANGGTYTCSFDGDFTGNGGAEQTDTVDVTVTDDDATTATGSDTATVSLTDRPIHVIEGNTTQTNTQTSTTDQSIEQSQSGGGIVVFGGDQNAANNSTTNLNNSQSVGGGDPNTDNIILGDSTQTNTQDAATNQQISQLTVFGSDPVIFGGSQSSSNNSTTSHNNTQGVGGSQALALKKVKAKAKARAKARAEARAKARVLARARAAARAREGTR